MDIFFESQTVSCRSLDYHKDTEGVGKLTKTALFIATLTKKHI